MRSERPDIYLEPGMSEPQLLEAFRAHDRYYDEHAENLLRLAGQLADHTGHFVDIRGRTGYLTDTTGIGAAERYTIIEPRPVFAEFLRRKGYWPHLTVVEDEVVPALKKLEGEIDMALCCEQASFLQTNYPDVVAALAARMPPGSVFGMTMGPSHHPFRNYRIADHRRGGVVEPGEVMSELCHPIHQRVHGKILEIVRAEHGYEREDAWPQAAKAFNPAEVQAANDRAGFGTLLIAERLMRVPGSQVPYYGLNGWTSFFRWPPLADLPVETKIGILLRAVTAVLEDPEYDKLAEIEAFHPTAYYLAIKH